MTNVQIIEDTRVDFTPKAWPICPTCKAAFVMRRAYLFTGNETWVWQRDCKHKSAEAVVEYAS